MEKIIIFDDVKIRRILHNEEWFYSVIDIIEVLTESVNPNDYWYKIKKRELAIGIELSTFCRQLKLEALDGKKYNTDCANTKSIFRIIQSIPSKKVEPFKLWLAQLGQDRLDEIENPELAINRTKEYYRLKGYPNDWIEKRIEGIKTREELTDEWKNREVGTNKEYAILTNEIHQATFGKNIKIHKEIKGLDKKNQNIRDHMSKLELIFSMLGEEATTQITKKKNSQGFEECFDSAQKGGSVSGSARVKFESEMNKKVISNKSFKKNKKN